MKSGRARRRTRPSRSTHTPSARARASEGGRMRKILVAALSAIALAAPASAQTTGDDFSWSGRVPAGQWLYIKNINGDGTVDRASGNEVEVVATKRARRDGDPARVRI